MIIIISSLREYNYNNLSKRGQKMTARARPVLVAADKWFVIEWDSKPPYYYKSRVACWISYIKEDGVTEYAVTYPLIDEDGFLRESGGEGCLSIIHWDDITASEIKGWKKKGRAIAKRHELKNMGTKDGK